MDEPIKDGLIPNGGRSITLEGSGGSITINVISRYSPSWKKEYAETYTNYAGTETKLLKGIRFTLTFSTYGLSPPEMAALKNLLMNSEEITLQCDEYEGLVTCDDFSPELQSANFLGDHTRTDITLMSPISTSGGRIVTVSGENGSVNFVVTCDYSAAWHKEYADSFTSYDGREIKPLKGIRFSLTFSPKGIPTAVLTHLRDILMFSKNVILTCDEFSGAVNCDSFTSDLQSVTAGSGIYTADINLTAVTAELPEDGL